MDFPARRQKTVDDAAGKVSSLVQRGQVPRGSPKCAIDERGFTRRSIEYHLGGVAVVERTDARRPIGAAVEWLTTVLQALERGHFRAAEGKG